MTMYLGALRCPDAGTRLDLYEYGANWDMEVSCGNKVFRVHSNIVCPKSASLKAAWEERLRTQLPPRKICIEEVKPDIVELMFIFIYTHEYDDGRQEPLDPTLFDGPLMTNTYMYLLGGEAKIPTLRDYAVVKFRELVETQWNHPSFSDCVSALYDDRTVDQDNRQLKDVVTETVVFHYRELMKQNRDGSPSHFKKMLQGNARAAATVLELMA